MIDRLSVKFVHHKKVGEVHNLSRVWRASLTSNSNEELFKLFKSSLGEESFLTCKEFKFELSLGPHINN